MDKLIKPFKRFIFRKGTVLHYKGIPVELKTDKVVVKSKTNIYSPDGE